ncbi:PucR family transcriptional regulator [Lachnoanaerobaculum saburreum]|jgi:transcriptional regulator, cdaR family|uniref:Purine catabolism regulatory protein-like family protein n=1 Tax=Lachnoanaerobaculum saburreum TaxID=467210 RepID=A0A134A0N3_9FIRM|nr:PucR family transcriptional regulator [Lachnoanaerobaculum saburreum]KXB61257.1 purine catabolism regulatory protein-like family protein [Lachnoanaerobaculum saburreum]
MPLTVRDIIENNFFPGTELITGRESAGNIVSWVNVQEILDSVDMVGSGELLITTGFDLADYTRYFNLIKRLKAKGVVGLMVQTGYYVDSIPVYILESARKYKFPVLELPASFSFSEVLKTLISEINRESVIGNQSYLDFNYFYPKLKKKLAESLERGIGSDNIIAVLAVSAVNVYNEVGPDIEEAFENIKSLAVINCDTYIGHYEKNVQMTFCLGFENATKLRDLMDEVQVLLIRLSNKIGLNLFATADTVEDNNLENCIKHCMEALQTLHSIRAIRGTCMYEHMTFLKKLYSIYRTNTLYSKENKVLRLLIDKDRESDSDYIKTVRFFLEENGNVTRAAKRLFVHRHTLINRMDAIKDITGFNFDDYFERLDLSLALMLNDYFD